MKVLFRIYHVIFSPLFHGASRLLSGNPYQGCKFEPTCSVYCELAIKKFGIFKGSFLGLKRVCRCHPFSSSGGYDPI